MDDREIALLVEFIVGRMEHLTRLASVSDSRTMARYFVALHFHVRPKLEALALALDVDPVNLPN